jgi:hypothetical protein
MVELEFQDRCLKPATLPARASDADKNKLRRVPMLVPISIQNRSFDLLLFEAGVPRAETAIAADHRTAAGLEGVKDAIFSYAAGSRISPGHTRLPHAGANVRWPVQDLCRG